MGYVPAYWQFALLSFPALVTWKKLTDSMENPLPLNLNSTTPNTLMEERPSQNHLSKEIHAKGSIKEVAVAQKEELQKIGAPLEEF